MGNSKPVVKLIGEDGNVFNLIGIVRRKLVEVDKTKEAEEMVERAYKCQSYDEVLRLFMEYVEIE